MWLFISMLKHYILWKKLVSAYTLSQLFEILQMVKQNIGSKPKMQNPMLKFAACIDDADAQIMQTIIRQEFNKIEGEW